MIRVLVADDSPTVRAMLVAILESDPEIRVVGEAKNGREAVSLAAQLRPDLITMDIQMPGLDGLEAIKEIMVHTPTPIVVVSSLGNQQQVELSLSATRAGAVMVTSSPGGLDSAEFEHYRSHLLGMAKAMAQVKVVRRWPAREPRSVTRAHRQVKPSKGQPPVQLVAIAASTGGPAALQRILMDLPRDFPVPVLVVQHIAPGFVDGLAHWLSTSCNLHVKVAEPDEPLRARTVYLAPDDFHLGVRTSGRILLSSAAPRGGFRPSASFLFESAAAAYGSSVLAVILTGMGRDGVEGLHAIHAEGGRIVAQDEATAVVYGMPREAVQDGIVDRVLPIQEIATHLVSQMASGDVDALPDSGR